MAMQQCAANSQIHSAGEKVATLDIILKGSVRMVYPGNKEEVILKTGSVIGLAEKPGEIYVYSYQASEETTIYSYPFEDVLDVDKVISVNKKIAPVVASATVANAYNLYKFLHVVQGEAHKMYQQLQDDLRNYPALCNSMGQKPEDFSSVEELDPAPKKLELHSWQVSFLQSFYNYDDKIQKDLYGLGVEMCVGTIYNTMQLMHDLTTKIKGYKKYMKSLSEDTYAFRSAFNGLSMEKSNMDRVGEEILSDGNVPLVENAKEVIMSYGKVEAHIKDKMNQLLDNYARLNDRSSTDENVRKLRRGIADLFYKVYLKVILRYFKEESKGEKVPLEVELFLKFGFMDERVVSEEDFAQLYRINATYIKDPNHKILTVPEWLRLIYDMELMPSKNEFDLDYPGYLREQKQNGEISEEEVEEMMDDEIERVKFELNNLVALGNRMTFGRISVFSPLFDSVNQMMPLEKCFASQERINGELNKIRETDFQIFYREYQFSDPELDLPAMTLHTECLPYIILMPNIGNRSVLWQEIDGKKRSTSARMLMPIFSLEDFSLAVTRMCGEFRWEMCKTEQGVHWNDISDPSLTAEYADFLQYYRKNSSLNGDQKEKVKKALQKAGNNYRKVFVADYVLYILYEANGSLRLSKVSRDILYRYCPLTFGVSEKLKSNGQYSELINRRANRGSQAARPIENMVKKREHDELYVPQEFYEEVGYLKK